MVGALCVWLVARMAGARRVIGENLRPTYLKNGLELCEQTSQAHSWVCEECACEVCTHNSKALANGGTHKFRRSGVTQSDEYRIWHWW